MLLFLLLSDYHRLLTERHCLRYLQIVYMRKKRPVLKNVDDMIIELMIL